MMVPLDDAKMRISCGAVFDSAAELKAAVLIYCNILGREYVVEVSKAKRVVLRCPARHQCSFRVVASVLKGNEQFTVSKKTNVTHSCAGGTKRKRNVKTAVLKEALPEYDSLIAIRGNGAKQVQQMVKAASNISLKPGQAASIATNVRGDPTAVAVTQFTLIETYMQKLEHADPEGTFLMGVDERGLNGRRQFMWNYIALGAAKRFWNTATVTTLL